VLLVKFRDEEYQDDEGYNYADFDAADFADDAAESSIIV
jgi:hypothetical protein